MIRSKLLKHVTFIDSDGILKEVKDLPSKKIISFDNAEMVRPPNISDQAWAVMQSQGAAKVAEQLAYQKEVVQPAAQAAAAAVQSEKQAEAMSGSNAIASLEYAKDLSDQVEKQLAATKDAYSNNSNEISPANVASVIANHMVNVSASAQAAAAAAPKDEAAQAAAKLTESLAASAIAAAAEAQQIIKKVDVEYVEKAVVFAEIKANDVNATEADKAALTEAAARLKESNAILMDAVIETNDAKQTAAEIQAKLESDEAAGKLGKPVSSLKLSWLDRIVEYIYKNVYQTK